MRLSDGAVVDAKSGAKRFGYPEEADVFVYDARLASSFAALSTAWARRGGEESASWVGLDVLAQRRGDLDPRA